MRAVNARETQHAPQTRKSFIVVAGFCGGAGARGKIGALTSLRAACNSALGCLDETLKIGNRICIMEGGRVAQQGASQGVVLNPAIPHNVAHFVAHMNPLKALRAGDPVGVIGDPELYNTLLGERA